MLEWRGGERGWSGGVVNGGALVKLREYLQDVEESESSRACEGKTSIVI